MDSCRVSKAYTDGERRQSMEAEERLKALAPLLAEIARRAEKMGIDDNGIDFTVTIDKELWDQIKDSI